MKRCSYTWPTWHGEKTCPEETWPGSEEHCIFHDPYPKKDAELFAEKLKEKLERKDYNFREYCFPEEVAFEVTEFEDDVNFSGAIFQKDVYFWGAIFQEDVNFWGVTFQNADFKGVTFQKRANFERTTFQGANFERTTFQSADFSEATFQGRVNFSEATFHNGADFSGATFQKDANFRFASFRNVGDFTLAIFQENADFKGVTFQVYTGFWVTTFQEEAVFSGATFQNANFLEATFQKEANFSGATFQKFANFWGTTFGGDADFGEAAFEKNVNFIPKHIEILDLRGSQFFFRGNITADLRKTRFHRAYLENVAFIDCKWPERIYEEEHMEDEGIKLTFKELETIYRDLKQNMQRHGNYSRAGELYYREMEMRRKGPDSRKERIWLGLYNFLAGYGEKPVRTAISALVTVFVFTFIYWLLGCLNYAAGNIGHLEQFIYSLYFSFVTFTTLGIGDIEPLTHTGRILICCEAVIGAFLIALFVVVFARKMMR